MTTRERKYFQRKRLNKKGIYVRTRTFKAQKFSMDDLKDTFCMCIPNYTYDMEGNIIPPKDGSKPTDTFHFGRWVDGKMVYDDK